MNFADIVVYHNGEEITGILHLEIQGSPENGIIGEFYKEVPDAKFPDLWKFAISGITSYTGRVAIDITDVRIFHNTSNVVEM